jgi:hypothetical protein
MSARLAIAAVFALALGGCSAGKSQVATDLDLALDVALAANGAYAARPTADPKIVANLSRLLAAAQAAVASWDASAKPEDQAVANAAIAALVSYEASAGVTQ